MRPTDILPVHGNQNRRPSCRPLLALFLISCLAGLAFSVLYGRISLPDLTIEFSSQPAAARREGASAGPESAEGEEDGSVGTRWAVLIAGSNGYQNYRHQADICHAYQILKKGGLKDANIIVFMYDDIAHDPMNPRPGVIINHPRGRDVYAGVPKDYTGKEVNVKNFFAVLLGDKTGVSGGSGKVVNSGPNDHIFIFYSDHGSSGLLTMPTVPSAFYGTDLVEILKKKHAAKAYKSLVFYLEACESGSIFKGILPTNIDVYATTSANSNEGSFGIYCLREYGTCLGDLYSVSWMENSEVHNLRTESLRQQYLLVKKRTEAEIENGRGSHVMQYGSLRLSDDPLYLYMGTNPDNEDSIFGQDNSLSLFSTAVSQRDADLVYLWQKYLRMPDNTPEKNAVWTELLNEMAERYHVDNAVALIGVLLFGPVDSPKILSMIRTAEEPLVDDWSCLKSMVHAYEEQCGRLSHYGLRHSRSFANMCNAGIRPQTMANAAAQACKRIPSNIWESIHKGSRA